MVLRRRWPSSVPKKGARWWCKVRRRRLAERHCHMDSAGVSAVLPLDSQLTLATNTTSVRRLVCGIRRLLRIGSRQLENVGLVGCGPSNASVPAHRAQSDQVSDLHRLLSGLELRMALLVLVVWRLGSGGHRALIAVQISLLSVNSREHAATIEATGTGHGVAFHAIEGFGPGAVQTIPAVFFGRI